MQWDGTGWEGKGRERKAVKKGQGGKVNLGNRQGERKSIKKSAKDDELTRIDECEYE